MHFISHQSQVSLSGPLSFVAPCDFRTLKGIKETSISLKVWHTKVSCEINIQLFSQASFLVVLSIVPRRNIQLKVAGESGPAQLSG